MRGGEGGSRSFRPRLLFFDAFLMASENTRRFPRTRLSVSFEPRRDGRVREQLHELCMLGGESVEIAYRNSARTRENRQPSRRSQEKKCRRVTCQSEASEEFGTRAPPPLRFRPPLSLKTLPQTNNNNDNNNAHQESPSSSRTRSPRPASGPQSPASSSTRRSSPSARRRVPSASRALRPEARQALRRTLWARRWARARARRPLTGCCWPPRRPWSHGWARSRAR